MKCQNVDVRIDRFDASAYDQTQLGSLSALKMSAAEKAYKALVVSGTNALCASGLSLKYADVSDEQKSCLVMTAEDGHTTQFSIDGVPCVAVSKPAGAGEERILVMYDSSDLKTASEDVKCTAPLRGKTAVKFTLERERGPYIMKQRHSNLSRRLSKVHKQTLCNKSMKPNGYTLDGPFIF